MRRLIVLLAIALPVQVVAEPIPCDMAARYAFNAAIYRDRGLSLEWAINTARGERAGAALYLAEEITILRDVWNRRDMDAWQLQARTNIRCRRAAQDILLQD